ncbi:hypothetical protein AHF37_09022 [Paragonimus kellicotti]|nr:hypothetical protein AHF37_09022 [Paragonimus kellicotti]
MYALLGFLETYIFAREMLLRRLIPQTLCSSFMNLTCKMRSLFLPPGLPRSLIYPHQQTPDKTPAHHHNPEVERLLKEELCGYPPYNARKIRHGFQDAIMIRDYKRRQVAAHFSDLRLRLNAIRKNTILPKEIIDIASLQIASLPRDSCWTRIKNRCVVTSRRRGVQDRWRISRIIWRRYADYNKMSGALWGAWGSNTRSVRRHMFWPPPKNQPVEEYIKRYYKQIADS